MGRSLPPPQAKAAASSSAFDDEPTRVFAGSDSARSPTPPEADLVEMPDMAETGMSETVRTAAAAGARPALAPPRERRLGTSTTGRTRSVKTREEAITERLGGAEHASVSRVRRSTPPRTGELLAGRYELGARIGTGAFGAVYKATDHEMHETIALKFLAMGTEEQKERLRREVRAARSVSHEGVVRIFDLVVDGDVTALSMELVLGPTLQDLIAVAKGGLDGQLVLRLARGLAEALGAIHAAGIFHRDLKPANVMFRGDRPIIMDFGISFADERAVTGAPAPRTGKKTSTVFGTPLYMAPEQLEGQPYTREADLYALGLVLYECITGDLPFHARQCSDVTALWRGRMRPPPPFEPGATTVPPELAAAILRLLEPEAARRFPSAEDFLLAWDRTFIPRRRSTLPPLVLGVGPSRVPPAGPSVVPLRTTEAKPETLPPKRSRVGAVMGGAFVVAAALATAFFVGRSRPEPVATPAASLALPVPGPPLAPVALDDAALHTAAVLGLAARGASPDDEWLAVALAELLHAELGGGAGLRLLRPDAVAVLLRDLNLAPEEPSEPGTLARMARHTPFGLAVGGRCDVQDGKVTLTLTVRETQSGAERARVRTEGPRDDATLVLERAAADLRARLELAPLDDEARTQARAALPRRPEAMQLYAQGLVKRRAYELAAARQLFERAERLDPTHAQTHAALADIASLLGDEARERSEWALAERYAAELPEDDRALIRAGRLLSEGRANEAAELYTPVAGRDPESVDKGVRLARLLREARRFEEGRRVLDGLSARAHGAPAVLLARADMAYAFADDRLALTAATEAAREAQARGSLHLLGEARQREGRSLAELGQFDEAARALEVASSAFRALGESVQEVSTEIRRGELLETRGDLEQARATYEAQRRSAARIGARHHAAWATARAASCAVYAGDTASARRLAAEVARGADATAPGPLVARIVVGAAAVLDGKPALAQKELEPVVRWFEERDDPGRFEAQAWLALAEVDAGAVSAATERARAVVTAVDAARPSGAAPAPALPAFALGLALLAGGHESEGRAALEAAASRAGDPVAAWADAVLVGRLANAGATADAGARFRASGASWAASPRPILRRFHAMLTARLAASPSGSPNASPRGGVTPSAPPMPLFPWGAPRQRSLHGKLP